MQNSLSHLPFHRNVRQCNLGAKSYEARVQVSGKEGFIRLVDLIALTCIG